MKTNQKQLASLLMNLTGNLMQEDQEQAQELTALRKELAKTLSSQIGTDFSIPFFQVDRVDSLEGDPEHDSDLMRELEAMEQEATKDSGDEEMRVFKRSSPVASRSIPGSVPHWGEGAKIAYSRGPFRASNGLWYWFDFFRITRMVSIYFQGQSLPALLLPLKLSLFQSKRDDYRIDDGSIWIRADLFDSGASANAYVGLALNGGQIAFSLDTIVQDKTITVPTNTHIDLLLELDQPEDPSTYTDNSGVDARKSSTNLPETCQIHLHHDSLGILELGRGTWDVIGDNRTFNYENGGISFSPLLNRIMVNCQTAPKAFNLTDGGMGSNMVSMQGEAPVLQAAWTLPITQIDINAVPDAAGIGAWAIETDEGISANWAGLEGGEVHFQTSWWQFQPGSLEVIVPQAGNLYAHQSYDLWPNEHTGFYSRAELQYKSEFPFRFQSLSIGVEALLTSADTEIRTDRPVKVNGLPFKVSGDDSLFLLYELFETRRIILYDPNILLDNLNLKQDPIQIYESHAIALNNVLLTVSQPISYMLSGTLETDTRTANGNLILLHGLFRFLPTLPDPYAANLGVFSRLQQSSHNDRGTFTSKSIIAQLLATVNWPPTTVEEKISATVGYQFFPIPNRNQTSIGLEAQKNPSSVAQVGANLTSVSSEASFMAASAVNNNKDYNPKEFEGPWNQLISLFGKEAFSLLDVSTHADLMGVQYGVQNEQYLYRITQLPQDRIPTGPSIPFQIEGMDLKASGKFAKAFTVPLVSWEPVFNLSDIQVKPYDPPAGSPDNPRELRFLNDGGPTRIFNVTNKPVTLAPLPLTEFIVDEFQGDNEPLTFSIFTLSFGMQALAQFEKQNPFAGGDPNSDLNFNRPDFDSDIKGGLQFKAIGAYNANEDNFIFRGNTIQLTNVIGGQNGLSSILGESVTEIFNREFSPASKGALTPRGVPVERIDMSGYGSNMFSNWLNNKAKFAQTSQAKFDVILGRTAKEVIQVRSMVYPWGIGVVRTIIMYRPASGFVYRVDSGWRADSDGVFDFNINIDTADAGGLDENFYAAVSPSFADGDGVQRRSITPYEFHPGIIKGVFNVQNIEETTEITNYLNTNASFQTGEVKLNELGKMEVVNVFDSNRDVKLSPVYFTADVEMEFVKEGEVKGRVPSKKMLGFVQLAPEGTPIPKEDFFKLMEDYPQIGGDVDCTIDIGDSAQLMRIKRVEINPARDEVSRPVFVGTPKGTPILPADGAWSLVQHNDGTGEVVPIADINGIPVIRQGKYEFDPVNDEWSIPAKSALLRIANAREMIPAIDNQSVNFAFLQNTGTQKVLFRLPRFKEAEKRLRSELPDFADAYHLLNSKGIFPNLSDITDSLDLAAQNVAVEVIEKGYRLVDSVGDALTDAFEQVIPSGPWYWVGTAGGDEPVKIYIEYNFEDSVQGTVDGALKFELDSVAEKWASDLSATTLVIDLGPFEKLFMIKGNFESKKGGMPGINAPVLEFGPDLKPIADVLTILAEISKFPNLDYAELLKKGLEIAMSNTPETWEYKFSAKKEIPVLRFPPPALDSPVAPLRIEASLAVGCYFNESLSLTTDVNQLIPSAGAFVEFYGQLSVMCVSVAAATVYAIGQTRVKIYADLEEGPGIDMEYGFGVQLAVGLPVIGTVSVTYMMGIRMVLDTDSLQIDAYLLFKGRAEILGGIVTVTIMIEARGSMVRHLPDGPTDMIAQVTFGLDISIFLVINLSFEESWEESRQIA